MDFWRNFKLKCIRCKNEYIQNNDFGAICDKCNNLIWKCIGTKQEENMELLIKRVDDNTIDLKTYIEARDILLEKAIEEIKRKKQKDKEYIERIIKGGD